MFTGNKVSAPFQIFKAFHETLSYAEQHIAVLLNGLVCKNPSMV